MSARYTIRHRGTAYAIETHSGEGPRLSRLHADGEQVDEQGAAYWEKARLSHGEVTFEVAWGPTNKVKDCVLVEKILMDGTDGPTEERTELDPPPGTPAARLAALKRDRPGLYASRRVLFAVGEVALAILGLGVLFRGLLPRIDWSWLPSLSVPGWLGETGAWVVRQAKRLPDPLEWLVGLVPDISWPSFPGWLAEVFAFLGQYAKFWVPIVVAIFLALGEYDRRIKKEAERRAREASYESGSSAENDFTGSEGPGDEQEPSPGKEEPRGQDS